MKFKYLDIEKYPQETPIEVWDIEVCVGDGKKIKKPRNERYSVFVEVLSTIFLPLLVLIYLSSFLKIRIDDVRKGWLAMWEVRFIWIDRGEKNVTNVRRVKNFTYDDYDYKFFSPYKAFLYGILEVFNVFVLKRGYKWYFKRGK